MEISKLKTDNVYLSAVAAFAIGLIQLLILQYLWSYITLYSSLPVWALEHGLKGSSFTIFFFSFGLLINTILCLPAAYAIHKLRPQRLSIYLPLAVIPGFLWEYRLAFTDPSAFADWTLFAPGVISSLLILPLAVFIIHRIQSSKRLTTQSR